MLSDQDGMMTVSGYEEVNAKHKFGCSLDHLVDIDRPKVWLVERAVLLGVFLLCIWMFDILLALQLVIHVHR